MIIVFYYCIIHENNNDLSLIKNKLSKLKAEENDLLIYKNQINKEQLQLDKGNYKKRKELEIIMLENEDKMNRKLTHEEKVNLISSKLNQKITDISDYTFKISCNEELDLLRRQITNEIIKRNHLRNILNKNEQLIKKI